MAFVIITVLSVLFSTGHANKTDEKRILLHSDTDTNAAILRLQSELENITKEFKFVLNHLGTITSNYDVIVNNLSAITSKYDDAQRHITTLETEVSSLRNTIGIVLNGSQAAAGGDVYIRWGRTVCPDSAELIYHGYTAGKYWNDEGSGVDHLCLPHDPTWGHYRDGFDGMKASVYGTEVDIDEPNYLFPSAINQQDMPCAVCRTRLTTTMMISARTNCYSGWSMEYTGYLMCALTGRVSAFNHICLDSDPEYVPHGGTNDDQHMIYPVEVHCGSLPCPPYVEGRELACVVCSK